MDEKQKKESRAMLPHRSTKEKLIHKIILIIS